MDYLPMQKLARRPSLPYVIIFALLLVMGLTLWEFYSGAIVADSARVYLQALEIIATLSLLYFAYANLASARSETITNAELAVRPILVWELEGKGKRAQFTYHTLKHPIYDLTVDFLLHGKRHQVEERHLDVSEANGQTARTADITDFLRSTGKEGGKVRIRMAYQSELGGKYEFEFTKEVDIKNGAYSFHHRKIIWAKYPWRDTATYFE
jgi:hypothetical protein